MNKLRYSLASKLSLGIMLMAIPIFVLALGGFYIQSRKLDHEEASQLTKSILNTAMQRAVNYMSAVENAAKSNAWMLEENFTPDSLQAVSQRIVARNRSIISCSVGIEPDMSTQGGSFFSVLAGRRGITIYSVRESDHDYLGKMWYRTARKAGKACWINPLSDSNESASLPGSAQQPIASDSSHVVASYSLPLYATGGRIAGVLAVNFSFTTLARNIMDTELPYPNAYFMLLGSDGRYLIHPDDNLLFKKTIFTNADHNDGLIALGHEMAGGWSGTAHIAIDGKDCHVCYKTVPGTDWSLALVIPSDEMMSSFNHLAYVILVLIVVGLFVIQWLCYRVVQQTITPINRLLDMTQKITNGQYDEVIPLSDRKDAVGQLQNSFSAMQQSIMTHMGHIEQTVKEIDEFNVEQKEKVVEAEEAIQRKNQFTSHVMYHVRKPLKIICECANVLKDEPGLPDEQLNEVVGKMKQNTIFMHRMVLMLFDVSETRASNNAMYERGDHVFCNQLTRECVEYVQGVFGIEIGFETEVSDKLTVKTNRLYLMNTIRELLYNAARHSDGQHIQVSVAETQTKVLITIQDVGPGLPDNSEDLIFEPFMKVDNLSDGLGLGLPLCKRHLISLGGDLIHDANYKDGCRFIMEVPK